MKKFKLYTLYMDELRNLYFFMLNDSGNLAAIYNPADSRYCEYIGIPNTFDKQLKIVPYDKEFDNRMIRYIYALSVYNNVGFLKNLPSEITRKLIKYAIE